MFFFLLSIALGQEWNYPAIPLPNRVENQKHGYLLPNEVDPIRAAAIWHAIPPGGVHLAVGTERGFIGAGLIKEVDTLVLADVDLEVVRYNRINALLLKISQDREDYIKLRTQSSNEWRRRAKVFKLSDAETQVLIHGHSFWKFSRAKDPLLSSAQGAPGHYGTFFLDANYLQYDYQFKRVQELARRNAIWTIHLDLFDSKNVETLARHLNSTGKTIHSIDASNTWKYGPTPNIQFVKAFQPAVVGDTFLILTKPSIYKGPWDYAGLQWRYLERTGFLKGVALDDRRVERPFKNLPITLDCVTNLGHAIGSSALANSLTLR